MDIWRVDPHIARRLLALAHVADELLKNGSTMRVPTQARERRVPRFDGGAH